VISGFHTAYNDWGPDDGLIVSIELGLNDPECQGSAIKGGVVRLSIYNSIISFGDQYTIGQDMSGVWCEDERCEAILSGTVEVTAYEDGIAISGFYDLILADGTALAGDLAAEWCDYGPTICG